MLFLNSSEIKVIFLAFSFIYAAGVEPGPILLRPFIDPKHQPWVIVGDDCGTVTGMNVSQGKPKSLSNDASVTL
jgi:hypothetical protein